MSDLTPDPVARALNLLYNAAVVAPYLREAAETVTAEVERLRADLASARAERDGLAEALRRCIGSLGVASSAGRDHPDIEFARAALAALPPKEDDDAA